MTDMQTGQASSASPQQATTGQAPSDGQTVAGVEAKSGEGTAAPAASESYTFTVPEGVNVDDSVLQAYSQTASELKLPSEAAQKLLDAVSPVIQQRQQEAIESIRTQWADEVRADKELGGDRLDATLATARKALDAFGSPQLLELLDQTGLGNNREVIRAFYLAGKAISEDTFVAGGTSTGKTPSRGFNELAKTLYPNQS
jgi:hypothetical protein